MDLKKTVYPETPEQTQILSMDEMILVTRFRELSKEKQASLLDEAQRLNDLPTEPPA